MIADRWIYGLLAFGVASWIAFGLMAYGLGWGVVRVLMWMGA